MARPDDEIDRFFSLVEYGVEYGELGKCLLWTGPKGGGNNKPPTFALDDKKRVDAIRYAYSLEHGDEVFTTRFEVTHRCGEPFCVNFMHLLGVSLEKDRPAVTDREMKRSDWCRNGRHMRSEFEKLDTLGRKFCGGCAEESDRRRREIDRAAKKLKYDEIRRVL